MELFPYTHNVESLAPEDFLDLVVAALREDSPNGDVTGSVFERHSGDRIGYLLAKEEGVICGLPVFIAVFQTVSPQCRVEVYHQEGEWIGKGTRICDIQAPVADLLRAERPALNFIGFLSAISSNTIRTIKELRHAEMRHFGVEREADLPHRIQLLDTRKTLPGFRKLSKYAVWRGGGQNHRLNLSEMGLIKDNHIAASGGVAEAVAKFCRAYPSIPFEVEITETAQIAIINQLNPMPKAVLLDNMDARQIQTCCQTIRPGIITEASGNWNRQTIAQLVGTGVHAVSMGTLTKSAGHFDFSFELLGN